MQRGSGLDTRYWTVKSFKRKGRLHVTPEDTCPTLGPSPSLFSWPSLSPCCPLTTQPYPRRSSCLAILPGTLWPSGILPTPGFSTTSVCAVPSGADHVLPHIIN